MSFQTANKLLMVRPAAFGFNPHSTDNTFQHIPAELNETEVVQVKALQEFDGLVSMLQDNQIEVMVFDDQLPPKSDAVFPNNWLSTHEDGTIITYPMMTLVRRLERESGILEELSHRFKIKKHIDLSSFERDDKFLEGTGSLVLDRKNKVAYVALSNRTHLDVLSEFQKITNYDMVTFLSHDKQGSAIYHTNVIMSIGENVVVVCLEAIPDLDQRAEVKHSLLKSNRVLVEITMDQLYSFCGNVLEVRNRENQPFMIMSEKAYSFFNQSQLEMIKSYTSIIYAPLTTIETIGGGSARCMIAEVFLE